MIIGILLPISALTALVPASCGDTSNDTARDIRNTREDAAQNAQAVAKVAEAEGSHVIALERCDALTGVEKDTCVSTADVNLASELALAVTRRDIALVAAEGNR